VVTPGERGRNDGLLDKGTREIYSQHNSGQALITRGYGGPNGADSLAEDTKRILYGGYSLD
jgi:hypothetical protein